MKRLVTFRMAPKKSSGKGKKQGNMPMMSDGWTTSKFSDSDIGELVDDCLLQSRAVVSWRSA